jgi:DNA polymerase III subunit delta
MATVHAFEFLESPAASVKGQLIVLFGNDRFLQVLARQKLVGILASDEAEFDVNVFDGETVQWRDVADSLHTASLFSQGNRLTVIDNGEHFAAANRVQLEEFLDHPPKDGVLVLVVSTWAASTRLYKKLEKEGCQVHCGEPQIRSGSGKSRDSAGICKWIVKRASQVHQLALTQTLARQLMEIVEWNTGRAEQEMAKLSLFGQQVDESTLRAVCGGWKVQSVWDAAMAATQGKTGEALQHLANLIQSGEHPLALYGQLSWSLRRFGRLWEISTRQMRQGTRVDLSANLARAGFRNWSGEMAAAESSATQLSRVRVRRFYEWLLETDLALKGTHSDPSRARFALERLFFRMARLSGRSPR